MSGDFEALANRYESETVGMSVTRRMHALASFKEIVALGEPALASIFPRLLRQPRVMWLPVLREITGENPGVGCSTIDEHASRWLAWGRSRGLAS